MIFLCIYCNLLIISFWLLNIDTVWPVFVAELRNIHFEVTNPSTPTYNEYIWCCSAVRHNNLKTVRALIASGELVNHACFARYTPLFIASRNGHLEVVKFLIASGGLVNQADNDGWTSLYIASRCGHFEVV